MIGVPYNYFGYQNPNSGLAYAGISFFVNNSGHPNSGREYIEVPLISPLEQGKKYAVAFYISLSNNSAYAVDAIGAYLSIDSVLYNGYYYPPLPYFPQIFNTVGNVIRDTTNWVMISGEYIADGGEKFLTIGNFNPDSTTAIDSSLNPNGYSWSYYYIDDVSVILMDSTLGTNTEETQENHRIEIYPNPVKEELNIEVNIHKAGEGKLEITDILGKEISIYPLKNGDNKFIVSALKMNAGIYFCKIIINNAVVKNEKVVILK
jgi:hypothetical protein